jgi:hypothetical protein
VRVDDKVFAGIPEQHDQHAEVLARTVDLQPLTPDANWLKAEIAARQTEVEGVA